MDWAAASLGLTIVAILGLVVSVWTQLPLGWALAIVAGALLANGVVATVEDDLPGGFNNPHGAGTPRYACILVGAARGALVALLVIVAIWLGATALVETEKRAPAASLAVAANLIGLAVLRRRRWAVWGAAASVGLALAVAAIGG